MHPAKLVLTQATNKHSPVWNQFPMLGLGYLASYLEKSLDFQGTEIVTSGEADEIIARRPNIVGISSVTENFDQAVEIAEKVKKETGARILIGGHHITNLPHTLPNCFDLAVLGEGEETLVDLIRLFSERGTFAEEVLDRIPGIAFRDREKNIKITGARALITPLDGIPHPDWKRLGIKPGDPVYMFSSRGCPYKCVFCSSTRYWQRFRGFSAEYVVGEIEELSKRFDVHYVYFYDDLFIADRKRLNKIVQLVTEKEINKKIAFGGSVRANLVDEETCRLLKTMGFKQINFGAESGSERVLSYLKGAVNVGDNQRAIDLAHKYGIEVSCSFIIGTPTETKEEALDTFRFILRNRHKLNSFDAHLMTAFPGTPIWDNAVSRGLVNDQMRWEDLVRYSTEEDPNQYIMLNDQMSRTDLMEVLQFLGSLRELMDWRNKARSAEDQLSALRSMELKLQPYLKFLPGKMSIAARRLAKKILSLK